MSNIHENVSRVIDRVLNQERPDLSALIRLLGCDKDESKILFDAADSVRRETFGNIVHIRAILEFSNYCSKSCNYCGIRRENRKQGRYRMQPEVIIRHAVKIEDKGYRTIVMQSGEDTYYTKEMMAEIVREIKRQTDMAVTLSLGGRDYETYKAWRDAGADRYLLRIETTNGELFKSVHPDDDLETRKRCLYDLRDLGYQLGTGVIVGLPNQTDEMLARDILWMKEMGPGMLGCGPLVPHPDTPMGKAGGGTFDRILNFIAVLRLVFPKSHIPAVTALGAIEKDGREKAMRCGANVLMLNETPGDEMPLYDLYPGKAFEKDDAGNSLPAVKKRLKELGFVVSKGRGHVLVVHRR